MSAASGAGAPLALVTGAAGAIGTATMRALVAEGHRAVGFDRTPPSEPVEGAEHYVTVDVADEEALVAAVDEVRERGPLAHVIGIAGGALPAEPGTATDPLLVEPDLFRASLEANLVSQFLVLRASLPWLREGDGDRSVTFTSSFNATSAQGMPAYSAAKAGLIGLMHALVVPLGAEGIRVNVVAPGTIRTPRTERIWAGVPEHFDRLEAGTALGRLGGPEDVAAAFVSLVRMRHVVGQVLVVDGGQTVIHR